MDVDDVLEPGERVIWRGRPLGMPLRRPIEMSALEYVVVVAILAVLATLLYPAFAMAATAPPRPGPSAFPWFDAVDQAMCSAGPLVALLIMVALASIPLLLLGMVLWRRVAYAITDRRVIVLGLGPHLLVLRSEVLRARVRDRSLEIDATYGRAIRFEEIEDPEAARDALWS
jgi:hypothetical protein